MQVKLAVFAQIKMCHVTLSDGNQQIRVRVDLPLSLL